MSPTSVVRRLRVEWKPQDCWIGVFWKRTKWWSGITDETQDALLLAGETVSAVPERLAHHTLDVYVCIVPMLPIHYQRTRCPRADLCKRDHTNMRDAA